MSKPISQSEAREMVRAAFNITPSPTAGVEAQIDVIIDAACRMSWHEVRSTMTREQFAARLESVAALFRHVMVPKGD